MKNYTCLTLFLTATCLLYSPLEAWRNWGNSSWNDDDESEAVGGTIEVQNEIVYLNGSTDIDLSQSHDTHIELAELRVTNNHVDGFEIRLVFSNEGYLVHTGNPSIDPIQLKNIRLKKTGGNLGSGLRMGKKTVLAGSEWGYSYSTKGEASTATDAIFQVQAKIPLASGTERLSGTYREYLTIHLLAGDDDD